MDFKDKEAQLDRTMGQLGRLSKKLDTCLNCGATDLDVDVDNDMITCRQCGSTWESIDSYYDEVSHNMTKSDQEGSH